VVDHCTKGTGAELSFSNSEVFHPPDFWNPTQIALLFARSASIFLAFPLQAGMHKITGDFPSNKTAQLQYKSFSTVADNLPRRLSRGEFSFSAGQFYDPFSRP
jgi:hypothetical protein